jgi:hypothetical protein
MNALFAAASKSLFSLRMRSGAAPLVAAGPTRSVFTATHHSGPREDRRKTFEGASTHVTPSLGSLATASADSLEKNVSFSATNCPLLGTVSV